MRLGRLLLHSPPIGEPLPLNLSKGFDSALRIIHALRGAIRVTEIKFLQIALQMGFGNVVIRSIQPALQQPEVGFDRVAVNATRARIFTDVVIGGLMVSEVLSKAHALVVASVVRVHRRLFSNVLHQDRVQILGVDVRNVEAARCTLAVNKGHDLTQMDSASALDFGAIAEAAYTPALGLTDVGLVHFDRAALPAHDPRHRIAESLTDAVCHEPCRFVGHAEGAVELMRAHALLGRTEKQHSLQPDVQLDLGAFKDRPYGYCELLTAILALPKARTMRLAIKLVVLPYYAAMRTYRAVRPLDTLKVFTRFVRVLEVRLVEGAH